MAEIIRIDAASPMVDEYSQFEIDQYNHLVNDYNLRCVDAQYEVGDMEPTRRGVEARRAELAQAGRALVLTWREQTPEPGDQNGGVTSRPTAARAVPAEDSPQRGTETAASPRVTGIPVNAEVDYTGHGWVCRSGYRQVGQSCVAFEIPANAEVDYTGHDWVCRSGYRRVGQSCAALEIPANAEVDYTGHDWVCRSGYRRVGQSCAALEIPANAEVDYTGHDWVCLRGYQRSGPGCVAVRIPSNAELDYTGHSWVCKKGYVRKGTVCIPSGDSEDIQGEMIFRTKSSDRGSS